MLIVRLWGGVGNQLFQYAFGQYMSDVLKQEIYYDIGSFGHSDKLRKFELGHLLHDIVLYDTPKYFFSRYRGVVGKALASLFEFYPGNMIVREREMGKWNFSSCNSSKIYFQGYWQEVKYAEFILKKGLLNFDLRIMPIQLLNYYNSIIVNPNSVSIHVRRGDYFSSNNIKIYGVCDKIYYEKAINEIVKINPQSYFYIFSDDLQWVKRNLNIRSEVTLIRNYDVSQYWYIFLMSKCKYNIISNSTFSWWGAFLNDNDSKIVISPQKWTLNSDLTIALDTWVKI